MEIFFGGSIRGGGSDRDVYAWFVETLDQYGDVLTEHVSEEHVEAEEAKQDLTDDVIHDRDLRWLRRADVVVAEVTTPSLGVGYEIGRAVTLGKPVLCCYRTDGEHDLSAMIRGNDAVSLAEYRDVEAIEPVLSKFCRRA